MALNNRTMCAIVPVRAGSKRVVGKNIRPFAGSSLLELKIQQLAELDRLDRIVVSSDSEQMLEVAVRLGVDAFRRPVEFASDSVPMSEVYRYLASVVEEDIVLFTHVTNPLCTSTCYDNAIDAYAAMGPDFDSLTTVSDVKDFLYWDGKAVNFDPKNKPRSQDLPEIVKLNHAISITPREIMIREKNLFGPAPFLMRLSDIEAFDIDTELDFEIAEFLFAKISAKRHE